VARTASIVDDQLTAGKVDLIFVHSDFRIPAVVTSLQAHDFKAGDIPVIGTDGASSALQAIRDGWATETIGIPLDAEVGGGLQFLSQIINKQTITAARASSRTCPSRSGGRPCTSPARSSTRRTSMTRACGATPRSRSCCPVWGLVAS
jgi:ABC-type sugar transport system substrate-binding protein